MKYQLKRGLAFMLTLAVFLSLFAGSIHISAIDLNQPYTVSWDHTLTDYEGNTFSWYGGINADTNDFGHSYNNGRHTMHDFTVKRHGLTGNNSDWTYNTDFLYAFCIEPGIPLPDQDEYIGSDKSSHGNKWALLSDSQKDLIQLALLYGYPNRSDVLTSEDANACYAATQLIVWQCALNWRTSPTSLNDRSYAMSGYNGTMTEQLTSNPYFKAYYDAILSDMAQHSIRPSFTGTALNTPTYELSQSGGQWTLTLTDKNNVLSNYYVSNAGGLHAAISGNTLTIRSNTPITSETQITLMRNIPGNSMTTGFLIWSVPGKEKANQDMVTGVKNDPVPAYFKLKVNTGNLSIIKTTQNNNGQVGGFTFRVKDSEGKVIGTYTSKSDGRILVPDLQAQKYTVEEINLSDEFVKPAKNPVEVEVKSGQTATVNFENIRKQGVITVQKINSRPNMGDYSLAGAEFTVKDQNGTVVDTIITGSDGRGQSKPLHLQSYTIFETKAPWGFVIDKTVYTRTLSGSQGEAAIVYCPEITVPEQPQVGRVKITKSDAETAAQAQGDATLSGAVFDLLDSEGNQVERLYCGDAESVTSKEVPLNTYQIKEIVPPCGYTLSQKEYDVQIDYAGQEKAVNLKSVDIQNTVIKGKIAIIKHSDSADPAVTPSNEQVQKPLENVVFRVWLKSAGSYEAAKDSERDEIITNKSWVTTKPLPFGTYVVEEYKGIPEHSICDPFDVMISENGRTYYYNIENPAYFGKVKIIKTDATTGKTIPQAGVEFKVKNTDTGAWVEQEVLYPTPTILTSFFTNAEGWLVLPQKLQYGNYELYEKQSPYGYTLSEQPVPFQITSQNPAEYLEVKMENAPAMGRVTVEKTGEVLVGADLIDGLYIPRYEVQGLSGATFDIVARRDIVTPDGSLRLKAGEIADTIITGPSGKAESKLLFLGDYYAIERKAPHGMVLNSEAHDFSLLYEDQTVPIVFTQTGFYNERQTATVKVTKSCEIPENASEEFNPYAEVVFGLFARNDILAVDGTTAIPANGLLEYLTFDRDGIAFVQSDLPLESSFYVRELKTGNGYALNETEYDFTFSYMGQEISNVDILVNEGKAIENNLMRGSLKIIKTFEGRETPIAGVPFTIEGTTTAGTEVMLNAVTNENGEILLDLLVGDYTVRELESKLTEGYVLSEEQSVTVAAGELTELKLENKKMRGDLKIIKTFEGKTTPVSGVKFTITGKTLTGDEFTGEFETDEKGEIYIEGLPAGNFKIQELASELTEGYVLSEEQNATVAHEEITELQIENHLIRGGVRLIKTDSQSDEKLAGAVFNLYSPNGDLLGNYTTNENGELFIEGLVYGSGYELIEKQAPEGYRLDEIPLVFDIKENGEVIELTAVNEKIPHSDNPQTGSRSGIKLWLALAGVSLGMLVTLYRRRNKSR